jgi:5-hydroxyisourate hydrolase-like protein (transthyretin family)
MKLIFQWFRRRVSLIAFMAVLLAACGILAGIAEAQTANSQTTQIPHGPYRIAGIVINAKGGSPLAQSRVTIADAKNQQSVQSVITNDDGRFEFRVPAGKYSLGGAKRGFIAAGYNQHELFSTAIVTGADLDTENITLRLAPNAVLTGKVLDEFGEPVRHAQVQVYRETHFQGVSRILPGRAATTDDQGHYEVTPLAEGTFFVSAQASPWYAIHPAMNAEGGTKAPSQVDSSLDVAYPITYYGDSTEADDATPIPVRRGDRLEADIHLNPVPALHLVIHVPEGEKGGAVFPILQKPVFEGVQRLDQGNIQYIAPGLYEMTGVAPGRYTVRAPDSNGQMQKEAAEINLSDSGELHVSAGSPTSKIKATVQIEGASSVPPELEIGLRNSKGKEETTQVDSKGEANFSEVIDGKYDVVAFSSTQRYSVVRITSDTGSVSGHALNVLPDASFTIAVSLVAGSVTIEGFAKQSGKAAAGAMIVLVPKNPGANRDRFRRDQSDLDGSFALPGVIPGSYTIIAIENGWDLDWAEPAVVGRYLKHGQKIEIRGRSQTTVHLQEVVEVQAK